MEIGPLFPTGVVYNGQVIQWLCRVALRTHESHALGLMVCACEQAAVHSQVPLSASETSLSVRGE